MFTVKILRFNINGFSVHCLGFSILGLGSKPYGFVSSTVNVRVWVRLFLGVSGWG